MSELDTNAEAAQNEAISVDRDKGNFKYAEDYAYDAGVGLNPGVVDYIAKVKGEDEWVREFRHKSLAIFDSLPMPTHWATHDLDNIDFSKIRYYLAKGQKPSRTWEEVPDDVKKTFERLGIPESERKFLAGVEAQFDSEAAQNEAIAVDRDKGNFKYAEDYAYDAGIGLNPGVVDYIAKVKGEDEWVREFRHKSLAIFDSLPMPTHWATHDLDNIDFSKIRYYLAKGQKPSRTWEEVPDDVKKTFERLGIPESERKFLAGVEAQFDSEAAYSNMKVELEKLGVIFCGPTEGLRDHPEIFRRWFGKVIPAGDNKFAALNSAVFSGGSFIYVPKGVKVKQPLQAYFRINAENFGQFERTLIIADEGAEVTYMEGCTAPKFETATLHSAVVELVALKGAKIQYITVQNWSDNVFNLVTKRGVAEEDAEVRWIDCNIGSRLTMKYPGVVLKGKRARGEVLSIALASDGQHQDTGAKMIHAADDTTSNIIAKSISVGKGRSTYRGLVHIPKHLKNCRNNTECDALLINTNSRTDTYPAITVRGQRNSVQHEASVSKVSADQIFYMMQRGLSEGEAMSLAVNGFINDLVKEFPMEYSVELKRLIELEMEGSVG